MSARIAAIAVGLCLVLGVAGCGDPVGVEPAGAADGTSAKGLAPDFTYTDLTGDTYQLSALRGRTVIIDFWATWCPPCVFQPSELNAFWERHRDSGEYQVLGVEVGGASIPEIREWAAENDAVAEYPVLTGADEDLARRFGALGFPALIIVDPAGAIHSVHVGLTTVQELEEQVATVLRDASGGPDPKG